MEIDDQTHTENDLAQMATKIAKMHEDTDGSTRFVHCGSLGIFSRFSWLLTVFCVFAFSLRVIKRPMGREQRMHDRAFRNRGNRDTTSVISVASCSINPWHRWMWDTMPGQQHRQKVGLKSPTGGAISPFDGKPGEASVFPAFVDLVVGSVEIGLTKKRRLLREYAGLSDNTNLYSGKDASMQDRNLFSLFWQV